MKCYKFLFLTLGILGLIFQIVIIRQTIEPHPSKASKQKTLRNDSIQFIQETPVKSSKNKTSVEFGKRAELVNKICDKYSDEHRPEFQGKCKINSNFKIFLFCHFQKHLLKFPGGGDAHFTPISWHSFWTRKKSNQTKFVQKKQKHF